MHRNRNQLTDNYSAQEIEEIYAEYLSGNISITSLIEQYGLHISPSRFISLFPPVAQENTSCRHCGSTLLVRRLSRAAIANDQQPRPYCPNCGHMPNKLCSCAGCLGESQDTLVAHQKHVLAMLEKQGPPVIADKYLTDLSIVVTLMGFIRGWASDDTKDLQALESDPDKRLVPNAKGPTAVTKLYQRRILLFSIENDWRLFHYHEAQGTFSYHSNQVRYIPNLFIHTAKGEHLLTIQETLAYCEERLRPGTFFERYGDQLLGCWLRIAREEVKEFVIHKGHQHGIPFEESVKLDSCIETLLHSFSVGQIYYLVTKVSRDTTEFSKTAKCHGQQHAANTFSLNLMRLSDHALAQGWDVPHYQRDWDLPRSMVSRILFDEIMNLAEDGGIRNNIYTACRKLLEDPADTGWPFCTSCNSQDITPRMKRSSITIICNTCGKDSLYVLQGEQNTDGEK